MTEVASSAQQEMDRLRERGPERVSTLQDVRLIVFYLPQYHPIPENDEWWGKGFTEWRNVVTASPQFPGHYQPRVPADLGFYDLRVAEVREAQAHLATQYGIFGFCYFHYWFNGKRLLHRPFDEVLDSGKPDFPFCLCWANESWTRRWDGQSGVVLIEQCYSEEDTSRHIRWLVKAFQDERYIRIEGKPLFLVYRANSLPHPRRVADLWRKEARRLGLGDLFLCRVESFPDERNDPTELGFDAAVEFQPDQVILQDLLREGRLALSHGRLRRLAERLGLINCPDRHHLVFDYCALVERSLRKVRASYRRFPGVTPSWDNSPRRKSGAVILHGSTPAVYEHWLKSVVERTGNEHPEHRIVFINAWNEWAEGNHLEPDLRYGHSYLEATKRACLIRV